MTGTDLSAQVEPDKSPIKSEVGFETSEEGQHDQSVIQLESPPSAPMSDKQPSEMPIHPKANKETITANTTSKECSFSPSILPAACLSRYSRNFVAQKRAHRPRDSNRKLKFPPN